MEKGEKGFIFTYDATLALLVTAIILTGIGQVGGREITEGGYKDIQLREYTDDAFKVLDRGDYLDEAMAAIEEGSENYSKAENVLEKGLKEAVPGDLIYEFDFLERPINVSSNNGINWENKTHMTTTFLADLPATENHIRILTLAPDGKDVTFTENIEEERPFWGIKNIVGTENVSYPTYTDTNNDHVDAGRAYDKYVWWDDQYRAEGSDDYLGTNGDDKTTLVELSSDYYVDNEDFNSKAPKENLFFDTLENEWENFDVVFIPGANTNINYSFNENQIETLIKFAENGRLVFGGEPLWQNQENNELLETFGIQHPSSENYIIKDTASNVDSDLSYISSEKKTEFAMYVRPIRIWYEGSPTETYLHPIIDGFMPLHLLHYPDDEPVYFYDDYKDTVSKDPNQENIGLISDSDLHKNKTGGDSTIYWNQENARVLTNWGRAPDGQILDLNGLIVNDPPNTEGSAVYIPANFVQASRSGEGSNYEWLRLAMNAISGEGLEFSGEKVQITIGIKEGS
mgnify:FL=1